MTILLLLAGCLFAGAFALCLCKAAQHGDQVLSDGEGFEDHKGQPEREDPHLARWFEVHGTLK